jgi:hypothetical protein
MELYLNQVLFRILLGGHVYNGGIIRLSSLSCSKWGHAVT